MSSKVCTPCLDERRGTRRLERLGFTRRRRLAVWRCPHHDAPVPSPELWAEFERTRP